MRDLTHLEHRALQVRWPDNGTDRGTRLCQGCVMEQAHGSAPEDRIAFEQVWHHWGTMLNRDRCVVAKENVLILSQLIASDNSRP